jgi:hypothetical protein
MDVKYKKLFPDIQNYSIEWGYSTWSEDELEENKDWSIRNRYEKSGGGFNVRGSSEIPWEDFKKLIKESVNENQFSNKELRTICVHTLVKLFKNVFNIKKMI